MGVDSGQIEAGDLKGDENGNGERPRKRLGKVFLFYFLSFFLSTTMGSSSSSISYE